MAGSEPISPVAFVGLSANPGSRRNSEIWSDRFAYAIVNGPTGGTLTDEGGGVLSYAPDDSSYVGPDLFTYAVSDGYRWSDVGTISLDVTEAAPEAAARACVMAAVGGQVVAVGAAGGATDADGDTLAYEVVDEPSHGTVSVDSDGSFTYTLADTGYTGDDMFTYQAYDGLVYSNLASVSVYAEATDEDGPLNVGTTICENQSVDLSKWFLRQFGYFDTPVVISDPEHGSLEDDENYGLIYTPDDGFVGRDKFAFYLSYNEGPPLADMTGSVVIDVVAPTLRLTWGDSPLTNPANNQIGGAGQSLACDPTPNADDLVELNVGSNLPLTWNSSAAESDPPLPAQYPVGTVFILSYKRAGNDAGDVRVWTSTNVATAPLLGKGAPGNRTSYSWTLEEDNQVPGNATGFPPATFYVEGDSNSSGPGDIHFTFSATLPPTQTPTQPAMQATTQPTTQPTAQPTTAEAGANASSSQTMPASLIARMNDLKAIITVQEKNEHAAHDEFDKLDPGQTTVARKKWEITWRRYAVWCAWQQYRAIRLGATWELEELQRAVDHPPGPAELIALKQGIEDVTAQLSARTGQARAAGAKAAPLEQQIRDLYARMSPDFGQLLALFPQLQEARWEALGSDTEVQRYAGQLRGMKKVYQAFSSTPGGTAPPLP